MQTNTPWLPDNPWKICDSAFPEHGTPQQKLQFLLNYATLAPSIYNTQPWTFRIDGDAVELLVDPNKTLLSVDPVQRQSILSCGAALKHFQLALRHFGCASVTKIFPNPSHPHLLATIRLGNRTNSHSTHAANLFMAIKKRRTCRGPFKPELLHNTDALIDAASQEEVRLLIIQNEEDKKRLAELSKAGEETLYGDTWVRTQRERWTHTEKDEGIPSFALAKQKSSSTDENGARRRAEALHDSLLKSPALLVFCTKRDSPVEWVKTGKALARILLELCCDGAAASFANQAIEIESLRRKLARMCGAPPTFPQLLLRAGYPEGFASEAVPRQAVSEKMFL